MCGNRQTHAEDAYCRLKVMECMWSMMCEREHCPTVLYTNVLIDSAAKPLIYKDVVKTNWKRFLTQVYLSDY